MSKKGAVYSNKAIFVEDFDKNKTVELKFKIEKVLFKKETFAIVIADVTWNNQRVLFPQNRTTILGSFMDPRVGDIFIGVGVVKYDKRYGYSVKLQTPPNVYTPRTKVEIVDFLSTQIDGIGKIKAEKIFDFFGEDTIQILEANPESVKKVGIPITSQTMECMKSRLVDGGVLNKLFTVLNLMQLREGFALKIYEKYGGKSYDELLSNPYIIAEVSPLNWRAADNFYYRQLKENKDLPSLLDFSSNPLRFRTAIKYFLKLKVELSGSLAYPLKELEKLFLNQNFWNRMSVFGEQSAKLTKTQLTILLSELEKEGEIYQTKSKTSGETFLYLQNSFLAETNIVQLIKTFNRNSYSKSTENDVHDFIEHYENKYGFKLAENQKQAVDLLANNKISILTGGPGSGKTTTVKAIKEFIDYLSEKGKIKDSSVVLLAPTGKAAKRLSEVLGFPASTIHRKLHLQGFGREENLQKIEEHFVIVDESSMIDVYLFSQLLSSLSPNSNLLLVGDENQLPSVGAGLILRDLIESKKVETVILNKVFRQADGSRLVSNAHLMKMGVGCFNDDSKGLIFNEKRKDGGLSDSYFIKTESTQEGINALINSYKRFLKLGFEHSDILILSAQKKGELGTLNINREIQRTFGHSEDEPVVIRKEDNSAFYIGDPVIQMVNDYENLVFNGETGVVTDILVQDNGKKVLEVTFEGDTVDENRIVEYSGYSIYDINIAYAITCHKSQGSESKVVIQIVDKTQRRTLNRSLVYTGYTRTREVNVIIGQVETLNEALSDVSNLERVSLIKERL